MLEDLGLARSYEDSQRALPHVGLVVGISEHFFDVVINAQRPVLYVLGMPHCPCPFVSTQTCIGNKSVKSSGADAIVVTCEHTILW